MKPWKIQKFFGDVVYDLRNRGLLPIVILLGVAMVAVPVLISKGGSSSPGPAPVQTANASELAPENMQAVVAYNPGLRSYKNRLADAPKDPFQQQHVQTSSSASALESTVPEASSPVATGTGSATPPTGDSQITPGDTEGGSTKKKKKSGKKAITYYYFAADVNTGEAGQPLTRYGKVGPLDPLPSATTPAFAYLGSMSGKVAIFSTSNLAQNLTGDGVCVPSPEDCSLLYLKPGQSEQLTYGPDGKTYRIELNALKLVRGKP